VKQNVELLTAAWCGDRPLAITFPSSWDVTVVEQNQLPPLPEGKIREALARPIAAPPLSELASGRKRAAILLDDITRPTPTATILPSILDELARAGLRQSATTIVIASGAHGRPSRDDLVRKIGAHLVDTMTIVLHDGVRDVKSLGKTGRGTPIRVNRQVMECDLKIGIGSLCPHPVAGFSGGSKILAPGVCGIETIRYLHDHFGMERRGEVQENEFREELDAIATIAGLDFVVNVVLNRKREISHIFAGDKTLGFLQGIATAGEVYRVDPIWNADILVANTYPFDSSLQSMKRGFWPFAGARPDSTRVVIGAGSMGKGIHRLERGEEQLLTHAWQRIKTFRPFQARDRAAAWNLWRQIFERKTQAFLMFCPGITEKELKGRYPHASLYHRWDDLLAELVRRHQRMPVRVAVYPSAPLQIPARGQEAK